MKRHTTTITAKKPTRKATTDLTNAADIPVVTEASAPTARESRAASIEGDERQSVDTGPSLLVETRYDGKGRVWKMVEVANNRPNWKPGDRIITEMLVAELKDKLAGVKDLAVYLREHVNLPELSEFEVEIGLGIGSDGLTKLVMRADAHISVRFKWDTKKERKQGGAIS
jgi:hypothetical protein